jgi:hypothetical protein
MTPTSAGGMNDAALPPGATWTNPIGNFQITVDWASPTAAQITFQPVVPVVAVPDVVGQTNGAASSTLKAAGFAVSQKSIVDPTCNNIGRVTSQSPLSGTPLRAGSTVTITVAIKPKTLCP